MFRETPFLEVLVEDLPSNAELDGSTLTFPQGPGRMLR